MRKEPRGGGRWAGAGSARPWVLWAQRQGWTKTKQKKCIVKKKEKKKEECHHLLAMSPAPWATKTLHPPPKSTAFAYSHCWPQGRAAESPAN